MTFVELHAQSTFSFLEGAEHIATAFGHLVKELESVLGRKLTDEDGNSLVHDQEPTYVAQP